MRPRGKRAAFLTVALGLGALSISLWMARTALLELWYIWKLDSRSAADQEDAASKLGEMGSVRAVPPLLHAWVQAGAPDDEPDSFPPHFKRETPKLTDLALGAIARMSEKAFPALSRALKEPDPALRRGVVLALGRMGASAAPVLLAAIDDKDVKTRTIARSRLGTLDPLQAAAAIARSGDVSDERLVECLQKT